MIKMIIDGTNAVFGRMATQVAKKSLLGESIDIVNCEKVLISGKKEIIFAKYDRLKKMGTPVKGPFYSSNPEKFLKRILRGMLPYKQAKGSDAFDRIKCYKGIPSQFEGKEIIKLGDKELRVNAVSISEICKHIGGSQ
jgi:large subunit ribosomal protein L13